MFGRMFEPLRLALLVGLVALVVSPAQAASVQLPIGDWVSGVVNFALPIVGMGIIYVLSKIGGPFAAVLRTDQAEQLLAMAISYGLNATAGAVKGKMLSVDVANQVVATALNYAVNAAPGHLISWLGGEEGIRDKILARLSLPEEAVIADGGVASAPQS